MAYILNIETATPVCSVALSENGQVLSMKTSEEQNIHSEKLTLFIEDLFRDSGIRLQALAAVAVSEGPGSYTGLRIGASVAKGLCYALDIPLIAVGTLPAMAEAMRRQYADANARYCPMIDARRMEVYTALYDAQGGELEAVSTKIIDAESFQDILSKNKIVFGGDGASKCRDIIVSSNAIFLDDFRYSAEGVSALSFEKWEQKDFADTAYFEPFYFKEFQAGKPKVKGLYDNK